MVPGLMATIYRTHIAARPQDDEGWGRTMALCGTAYPDAAVFNEPEDTQPMCPTCMKRWEKLSNHEKRVGR